MKNKKFIGFALVLTFAVSLLWALPASACAPGDSAEVLWNGTWYPAHALRGKGNQCYIHYDGYGSNWDEWVGPERMKLASASVATGYRDGDPVQVLWKGSWWPAHVLQARGPQLKIHYDGYGSNWDEWVGPSRYR